MSFRWVHTLYKKEEKRKMDEKKTKGWNSWKKDESSEDKRKRFDSMVVANVVMVLFIFVYFSATAINGDVIPGLIAAVVLLVVYAGIMICECAFDESPLGTVVALVLRVALMGLVVGACFIPGLISIVTYIFAGLFISFLLWGALAARGMCRCITADT